MAESIQQLRIYTNARALEDRVYDLVHSFPPEDDYPTGNNLRRSSAAVSHFLAEAHRCYSYGLKLDSLAQARAAAEETQRQLETLPKTPITEGLFADYTGVIKQSWGLIRYLKLKRTEQRTKVSVKAKDELAAARST